ncbi:2Fe-2S iron-sulfur cluster-binding protein [Niveispirillum sp. KHB5.9]|uniref:2Fe-2S iron-sulfur cluster-binding protein n=1 Tax=Niveispirillum sp. KHB5.9 TaxID=3400269 RepID=UPI003A867308
MPRVTFINSDGFARTLDIGEGETLMEAARGAGIEEILAECGGACACATCHVHVDPAWMETVGPASGGEAELLDYVTEPGPTARLSCQITMAAALDGLVVRLPRSQQ